MAVINIHERVLDAPAAQVGILIDGLASDADALWPHDQWPPMRFDRPLGVGAAGGHGPVRYVVESYEPGRSVRFRFTGPAGFLGHHRFEVEELGPAQAALRHVIEMRPAGTARLTWPLVFRPLHDALLEDALDRAETHVGGRPAARGWSPWVRALRWVLSRAQRR
ncbi:MAG: SRPBCC family protein [Chloroflexi bacterium]|nr:SRPBCC family protein [Chloroflexota bacterium]MBU1748664.1 SRPBCC family protein [Chloroflexota bacterium]MBU1878327.1 SRPBCC family protein [Chloroflexota bacterium]